MNNIKHLADVFIKENKIYTVSFSRIKKAAENTGFTVLEFKNNFVDKDVNSIVNNLHLDEYVKNSKGFTFANEKYRFIFINGDLSEKEKMIVLAHELGHIVCKHFGSSPVIGQDVLEEFEANEFAHYLIKNGLTKKIRCLITSHKKIFVAVLALLMVVALSIPAISIINRHRSYYGEFYITDTGNRYHKKGCIFVKDKTNVKRLTKEEFEAGKYEPCDMCLPN